MYVGAICILGFLRLWFAVLASCLGVRVQGFGFTVSGLRRDLTRILQRVFIGII